MACYYPLRGWRTRSGCVTLGREPPDSSPLPLPCGRCIGCQTDSARGWALRCWLEMRDHQAASFATLTYSPEHVPPALDRSEFSSFAKRLRRALGRFRFFGCGEYGAKSGRPHFHAILFGLDENASSAVERAWGKGIVTVDPITPARIAYVAGYTQKKVGSQKPFRIMSRRPGIGSAARARFPQSWRSFAVTNGHAHGVPRFLHKAWEDQATDLDLETLDYEKYVRRLDAGRDLSYERLEVEATVAEARHARIAERRQFDARS